MGRVYVTKEPAEVYRRSLPRPERWETIHFRNNKSEGFVVRRKRVTVNGSRRMDDVRCD
jgi:hypothetical protein